MVAAQELLLKVRVDTSELDAAIEKYHEHVWVFDTSFVGFMGETFYVYHCDAHDPPVIRSVGLGNGWYVQPIDPVPFFQPFIAPSYDTGDYFPPGPQTT